jgi:hypothetical protein
MDCLFTGFGIRLRMEEEACQQQKENMSANRYPFFIEGSPMRNIFSPNKK